MKFLYPKNLTEHDLELTYYDLNEHWLECMHEYHSVEVEKLNRLHAIERWEYINHMKTWCKNNGSVDGTAFRFGGSSKFWFDNEEDAVLFALKFV